MTLSGAATCIQHTTRVSGGGQGSPTSTTFLTLFRIEGRQCMIKTTTPVSMAEGDRIVASGNENSSGFTVYAVRNATSGISSHSGIWGKVVLGLFFPLLGLFFCGLAALFLGAYSLLLYLGFVAYSIYLFYQAYMAASARRQVAVHPL